MPLLSEGPAKQLIADRGYDSDSLRAALVAKGIMPCISPRKTRKAQHVYDRVLYRQRRRVENMFAKLKNGAGSLPLRPIRPHLHVRHRHRCNRALLAQSMSPEPKIRQRPNAFYARVDAQGWVLGEAFEPTVAALQRELTR